MIKQGTTETMYYVETDNPGSVISLLNADGTYAEKYLYDAWGRRRNAETWDYDSIPSPTLIDRGFTGQEHLDEFGLINMNGRMYDPYIGRFLGVDPFIQFVDNSQSYNGYSYCLNNPLKYSDPSGMLLRTKEEMTPLSYNDNYYDFSNEFANRDLGGGGGGPGQGRNGYGLNGVFWDYESDCYRSTSSGEEVPIGYVQSIISRNYDKRYDNQIITVGEGKPYLIVSTFHSPDDPLGKCEIRIKIYGKMYSDYNWVQTCKYESDPPKLDYLQYNHGFYYTKSLQTELAPSYQRDADGFFQDDPNGLYFTAELTLCGEKHSQWEQIQTIGWGYYIENGRVYDSFIKINNQTDFHRDNVNSTLDYFNQK